MGFGVRDAQAAARGTQALGETGRRWQAPRRTSGGGRQRQYNCKSRSKMDLDAQKTKSHSNQSTVLLEEECECPRPVPPENSGCNAGCLFPAPLAPLPSQWPQTHGRRELGPTGQGGTEAGVLRWQRSTMGAGPSGLTEEGRALLPHKGVLWPLAGPMEQAGVAGASVRAPSNREHSRLGPSAHRTQGGQRGKSQGQHPGFWRVGPWWYHQPSKPTYATQGINSREKCRWAPRQGPEGTRKA